MGEEEQMHTSNFTNSGNQGHNAELSAALQKLLSFGLYPGENIIYFLTHAH